MTDTQALQFAIDKLTDLIDRDFDGDQLTDTEVSTYHVAVAHLTNLLRAAT